MSFFPVGPNFVFSPRRSSFARLSRRNEFGEQGLVGCIAIEPGDSNTIYVVVRPSSGGSAMFRTRDGGATWDPIGEWLRATRPGLDPVWIAIHPTTPSTIYLASSAEQAVYVSNSRGDAGSWSAAHAVGANPLMLLVDARTTASLATTVIFALGWRSGVHRSSDGGVTWPRVLTADPTWIAASMPATGTAHFYVGDWARGLWHATDPTASANWTNLATAGIGLPSYDPSTEEGNYNLVRVDLCKRDPSRVYAWFTRENTTTGLYTTSASTTSWTRITSPKMPTPEQGLYTAAFAVAPNSPGNGTSDILFIGNTWVMRSTDAGRTWTIDGNPLHADIHTLVFDPSAPASAAIPTLFVGCDGGIGRSVRAADPAVAFETALTDFNEGTAYSANLGGWANLNHGLPSVAGICYSADPAVPALSYVGCQDTGIISGEATLGWRGLESADVATIAVARGPTSMSCWIQYGDFSYYGWPGFRVTRFRDVRTSSPRGFALLSGALIAGTSNFTIGVDGKLLAGVVVRDGDRTIGGAVAIGAETVTPSTMTGIHVGARVVFEPDVSGQEETVTVTSTTATTFRATFVRAHPATSAIKLQRALVARVAHDDTATQVSQDFGDNGRKVKVVAAHPTNAEVLYCAVDDAAAEDRGQHVFTTNAGVNATASTVWTEVATNRPAPGTTPITWICVDNVGTAYVLWLRPLTDAGGTVTTPLYSLSGGAWTAEPSVGVPGGNLGKLIADPVRRDVLYVNVGATVFQLLKRGGTWTWTDIGAGLPGVPVYDVAIFNLGTAAAPKVVVRAVATTRGVYEADVTADTIDPPRYLYLRDHLLDHALLPRSAEGVQDPFTPTDPNATFWHYMCADVKVDVSRGGIVQTQSEGAPATGVTFDMLRDNSQSLTAAGSGRVYVQVHNRSRTATSGVKVWAIYCRASGGVPALSRSALNGDAFAFWDQFTPTGDIVPALPADSPWTSIGVTTLDGIDVEHPRVATFVWMIPTLTAGDTGHYCIAVFVHSSASPINETTDMSVDSITPRNRQVGQKNLHVVLPGPGGTAGGTQDGLSGLLGIGGFRAREYVEFHNPTAAARTASLRFDLRSLPPDVRVALRFTPMKTAAPLAQSMAGVARTRRLMPGQAQAKDSVREAILVVEELKRAVRAPDRWPRLAALARERLRRCLHCVLGDSERKAAHGLPRFEPQVHEAVPSAEVMVRDVELPPFGQVGALIEFDAAADSRGVRQIQVQQLVGRKVVGGSVYVVGAPIDPPPPQDLPAEMDVAGKDDAAERQRREREARKWRYMPPWLQHHFDEREVELGKRTDPKREPMTDDVPPRPPR